jgi:metal-sulfur cluster biosynthetic enzyme
MKALDEDTVTEALRQVIDPELGCNLVDLGLIYGTEIELNRIKVTMTLTTPGCPMHESLVEGVRTVLLALERVAEVEVEVVWDPPWHPSMMTAAGRGQVGVG